MRIEGNPDEKAFYKVIYDRPADDMPRAVFADYLEEKGLVHAAAWWRAGGAMPKEEYYKSIVAQHDDEDYEESGFVACVVERAGLKVALIGAYGHCSCYGTWTSISHGGINDPGSERMQHWVWIGSVEELVDMARRDADPFMPSRTSSDEDNNVDHLRGMYKQVLAWAESYKEK